MLDGINQAKRAASDWERVWINKSWNKSRQVKSQLEAQRTEFLSKWLGSCDSSVSPVISKLRVGTFSWINKSSSAAKALYSINLNLIHHLSISLLWERLFSMRSFWHWTAKLSGLLSLWRFCNRYQCLNERFYSSLDHEHIEKDDRNWRLSNELNSLWDAGPEPLCGLYVSTCFYYCTRTHTLCRLVSPVFSLFVVL